MSVNYPGDGFYTLFYFFLIGLPCALVLAGAYFGARDACPRLPGKTAWLLLAAYGLSLCLPALMLGGGSPAHGAMVLLTGMAFFWMVPVSLPVFANFLFAIVFLRLILGKRVRFFAAELTVLLMFSAILLPLEFSWGYLIWLVSGCLLWTACRTTQHGASPVLWRYTAAVCLLVCAAAFALGLYQKTLPSVQAENLFRSAWTVFASLWAY